MKVRVEATTELETDTPNANDAVEFYFYIDTGAPMDDPSSIRAIANELSPTYTEYLYLFQPRETWFIDYTIICQIQKDPETGKWNGSAFSVVSTTPIPGNIMGYRCHGWPLYGGQSIHFPGL